jgi:hypothetical protein
MAEAATTLIEYDNTQNDANHIHSVWRDLAQDWGEDLLTEHYAQAHWECLVQLQIADSPKGHPIVDLEC